ncbi:hypothetical protein [Cellulosimicrobium cellulans]|uniref:MmyB family transcriptional regulator n=1 Tax=Cellulosimicrobium cellulans TaxID=1710 RepID=UPI003017FF2E
MHEKSISDEVVEQLVTTWHATPALAVDRYLDVRAANALASETLGLRTGVNLARLLYLEPGTLLGGVSNLELRQAVAGALREAVERYGPDARFESVVGELLALSPTFGTDFERWPASRPIGRLKCSAFAGRQLDFSFFDAPATAELRLVVLRAFPSGLGPPSGSSGSPRSEAAAGS